MLKPSRTVIVTLAALAGLLSACGAETDPGAASDHRESSSPSPEPGPSRPIDAVPCATLIDAGWTAPDGDPDIQWDPLTGRGEIAFGEESPLVIDVHDPDCAKVPDIGVIVTAVVEGREANRASECEDSVHKVIAGEPPVRADSDGKELVGNVDAVREHVAEWCPPEYEKELRDAGE